MINRFQMYTSKTKITVSALALAAIAVVGVILWLTYTPSKNPEPTGQPITVEVVQTPSAQEPPDSISQEAVTPENPEGSISEEAIAFVPGESPAVMGASVTAPTGPAEYMLALFGAMTLVGLGSSLFLAKFA